MTTCVEYGVQDKIWNMARARLTPNSLTVLNKRYLWKDDQGKVIESPEEMFRRVARCVAAAESSSKAEKNWREKFEELMLGLRFIPNSPTLFNAGRAEGQLSACYVLPIDDSLVSIFETLKNAALIHQSGGGTGFSFSNLRPKGSIVRTTQGVASGPVSFMRIYDVATDTIKQGGTRRGANMAVLRVDHPDIYEFVGCKLDLQSITNFNISVGITDEFMDSVVSGAEFGLRDSTGKVVRKIHAGDLFHQISLAAWRCGDPGLVFLDRIDLFNPTPMVGVMESTNPCGEQPLLPYESCNLGSMNLSAYVDQDRFNWKKFSADVQIATRFLDNVIDVNHFPVKACRDITLKNRKIGLGVMGFADVLLKLEIPYACEKAYELAERVMGSLDCTAKKASQSLAKERGAFRNWRGSLWSQLGYPEMRNATVSTVAPTGSISLIAGVSSGIEPVFSARFFRNILSGERIEDVHPLVAELLGDDEAISIGSSSDEELRGRLGPVWSPSHLVPVEAHIRMQAAFQRHSDSAVSKTVNLPEAATVDDVASAYTLAYQLGCKGITVYRDRSRPTQVLEGAANAAEDRAGTSGGGPDYCPSC